MSYDLKRITGFISAIGLAGVAAAASAQETEQLFGWDADADQMISQEEFDGAVERGPWAAEMPRGFEDPDGGGVDNLYNFSRYDANQDMFLDETEMGVFGEEAGMAENEGWDWTPWDTDQDAMLSEPEYMAGLETVEAPYEGGSGVSQDNLANVEVDPADFGTWDTDRSGYLEGPEFTAYTQERTIGFFQEVDADTDELVSEQEFEAYFRPDMWHTQGGDGTNMPVNTPQFAAYDDDGDGYISATEFEALSQSWYGF